MATRDAESASGPASADLARQGAQGSTVLGADEVVSALVRGTLGVVPGLTLVAELAGLGVLVAGRLDRMRQTAREMADAAGGSDILTVRIRSSEDLEVLVIEALENASRTSLEAKRILLGRVVARAALDDARVDEAQVTTAVLRELDAPHIRALERLRKTEDDVAEDARRAAQEARQGNASGDPDVAAQNRHSEVLGEAVRRAGDRELEPIRSALIRTGVVQPATLVNGGIAIYRVSDFGRRLLAELNAVETPNDR